MEDGAFDYSVYENRLRELTIAYSQVTERRNIVRAFDDLIRQRQECPPPHLNSPRCHMERVRPVQVDYVVRKEGLDMTLSHLRKEGVRLESRADELSRVLDASANEQQINEMYHQGRISADEYQALLDLEQIRMEQARQKQELVTAHADEKDNQFWVERAYRHRFYAKLYPEHFGAERLNNDDESMPPLTEYDNMCSKVAEDCKTAVTTSMTTRPECADAAAEALDGVLQFPCLDRVTVNKDMRPLSFFSTDNPLSQAFLRESAAMYSDDKFRLRDVTKAHREEMGLLFPEPASDESQNGDSTAGHPADEDVAEKNEEKERAAAEDFLFGLGEVPTVTRGKRDDKTTNEDADDDDVSKLSDKDNDEIPRNKRNPEHEGLLGMLEIGARSEDDDGEGEKEHIAAGVTVDDTLGSVTYVVGAYLKTLKLTIPLRHRGFNNLYTACLVEHRRGRIGSPDIGQLVFDFAYYGTQEDFSGYELQKSTKCVTLMLDILVKYPKDIALNYVGLEMIMRAYRVHPMPTQFAVPLFNVLKYPMRLQNELLQQRVLAVMGVIVNPDCVVDNEDISFCITVLNTMASRLEPVQLEHAMQVFLVAKKGWRISEQLAWARHGLEMFRFEPKLLQRALLAVARLLEVYITLKKKHVEDPAEDHADLLPSRALLETGTADIPLSLVELVCQTVDICPDNRKVAGAGSLALGHLVELSSEHLELVGTVGLRTALFSYQKWPDSYSSSYNLCKIYCYLGTHRTDLVGGTILGAHRYLLHMATTFAVEENIARWALEALIRCADRVAELKPQEEEHRIERNLVMLGERYMNVADVLELVCILMRRLAEHDKFLLFGFQANGGVAVPLRAMYKFPSNGDLIEEAASVLRVLTSEFSIALTHCRRLRALYKVMHCLDIVRDDIDAVLSLMCVLGNLAFDDQAVDDFMDLDNEPAEKVDLMMKICLDFGGLFSITDEQRQQLCALTMRAWSLLLANTLRDRKSDFDDLFFVELPSDARDRIQTEIKRILHSEVAINKLVAGPSVLIKDIDGNRLDGYPTYDYIFGGVSISARELDDAKRPLHSIAQSPDIKWGTKIASPDDFFVEARPPTPDPNSASDCVEIGATPAKSSVGQVVKEPMLSEKDTDEPTLIGTDVEEPTPIEKHTEEPMLMGKDTEDPPTKGKDMQDPPTMGKDMKKPMMNGQVMSEPMSMGQDAQESMPGEKGRKDLTMMEKNMKKPIMMGKGPKGSMTKGERTVKDLMTMGKGRDLPKGKKGTPPKFDDGQTAEW